MTWRGVILGLLVCLGLPSVPALGAPAEAPGEGLEIAVVVDTSRSMQRQDARRYTVQILRILTDLLADEDDLHVIRMPRRESCGAGPDPRLALHLGGVERRDFKDRLDRHLAFDTGTYFAASLRTAVDLLDAVPERRRLLLVLADAGGLGGCAGLLGGELAAARGRGMHLAAVHLGRGSGAFDGHPAFESTTAAGDAEELIAAVALVYQRFLGVKQVQSGRVEAGRIEGAVAPYVERAFLVVAADGEVGPVRPAAGHPAFGELDPDFRGGGATLGLDRRLRSYRIVRLERPEGGHWRFELPELREVAGWMLVQESALGVRLAEGEPWVVGQPARLVLEVFDRRTGERVGRSAAPPGLDLTVEHGGRSVRFRDDGAGGDRVAGDGLFTAELGPVTGETIDVRLRSEIFDQSLTVAPEVRAGMLELAAPAALDFGTLEAGSSVEAVLDLSASKILGRHVLELGSDLDARGVSLEIDAGGGYERLAGAVLELSPSSLRFPVRLRVRSCPRAIEAGAGHRLWIGPAGEEGQRVDVRLELQVLAEPWLTCWWPVLALGAGVVAAAVAVHGWLVPSRFSPRAGLQLAQEEALDEGFFHAFRAQQGSGSGFYRDARLFLHVDFRLSSSGAGALARLRARTSGVDLLPLGELWRRTADGEWERLEAEERRLRPGVVHRGGGVYFELRNG